MLLVLGIFATLTSTSGCDRPVAGGQADGPAIFKEICARCHGESGEPPSDVAARMPVPALTSGELQERLSDKDLRLLIRLGSPKKGMPGFSGALTDAQLDALIAHVRTLRK